ncbi:MAG: hypothetical protein WDN26_17835 [Chitinophagaceae bacterium]
MKKVLVSIVLICYLAVTSGVLVNFHYCMNRLASTELFAAEGKKCGTCKMDINASNGCCHDEVKIVKMEEDQKVTPLVFFELPSLDQLVSIPSEFIVASFYTDSKEQNNQDHSPPLLSGQDTYLQNCVFRI